MVGVLVDWAFIVVEDWATWEIRPLYLVLAVRECSFCDWCTATGCRAAGCGSVRCAWARFVGTRWGTVGPGRFFCRLGVGGRAGIWPASLGWSVFHLGVGGDWWSAGCLSFSDVCSRVFFDFPTLGGVVTCLPDVCDLFRPRFIQG